MQGNVDATLVIDRVVVQQGLLTICVALELPLAKRGNKQHADILLPAKSCCSYLCVYQQKTSMQYFQIARRKNSPSSWMMDSRKRNMDC